MRKLTLCAAAVAAMTGMAVMTSQASVITYGIGGNCGNSNGNNSNGFPGSVFSDNNCGNSGNLFSGNAGSVDQLLQMIVSSNSGSSCPQVWDSGCGSGPVLPGTQDIPMLPGCSGTVGELLKPNLPSWECPTLPGCQEPGSGDSGDGNPGTENPGTENPGTENPGIQSPGTENPGIQNPGTENPGTQNPGTENPGTQNPGSDDTYARQVIELVNEERAKAGLSPVTEIPEVSAAAEVRAQEIARNFSHTRPNGTNYDTVLSQSGVSYRGSGENIAYGQQSAAAVMSGWMNSQGHRANILNGSFTGIGVACYENANGVKYWVQLFTY